MKYLVLETHLAYAVVLDETGRFLRVANRSYRVGETVTQVCPLRDTTPAPRAGRPPVMAVLSAAACLCLVLFGLFFGYYQPNYTAYGSLRMQINPEVELTLSRSARVLSVSGCNEDGEALLDGYDCRGKTANEAVEELVERALSLGYLENGGLVALQAESDDADWQAQEEGAAAQALEARYGGTITVITGPAPEEPDPILAGEDDRVVIAIDPLPDSREEAEAQEEPDAQEEPAPSAKDNDAVTERPAAPDTGGGNRPSGGGSVRPAAPAASDDDDGDDDDGDDDDGDDDDNDDTDDDDGDDDD